MMYVGGGEASIANEGEYYVSTSPLSNEMGRSIMIKPGDYLTDGDRSSAERLADWLNAVRMQATDRPGHEHVVLPAGLWEKPLSMHTKM
jgi:hypothetical protein